MSFGISALGPEAGYSQVNVRQIYDVIATAISGQGWTLVDTVDFIVTTTTYRRYVWKAPLAITGLPNDFHVIFEARFTTIGTVWSVNSDALRVFVCQDYDVSTNVGSKFVTAASATSITLNSDLTAPTSWDLDAALPSTAGAIPLHMGLNVSNSASASILVAARADHFVASNGLAGTTTYSQIYVGAIESEMSSSDDPMPVVLAGANNSSTFATNTNATNSNPLGQLVGFLTHPKLTPGGSYAYVFQGNYSIGHLSNGAVAGPMMVSETTWTQAQLGTGGVAPLFLGAGVVKVPVSTSGNTQTAVTRGGRRGYLKGVRCTGQIIGTGMHDTYTIDGNLHYSIYSGGLTSQGALVDSTL